MGFMSMLRINSDTFHWLAELLRPEIQGQDTTFRKATRAEVNLSVTLNYLAIARFIIQRNKSFLQLSRNTQWFEFL